MDDFLNENLCHDPIHGYIRFVGSTAKAESEICERQIIDHPWVQRMRQIRQLQTAWWVYPTAEHSRFQHILGVMHLAGRAVDRLYQSLASVDPDLPSKAYVASLMRMAALLHDVGHGPFGHFFDEHFLRQFELTHESLGAHIIQNELAADLSQIRHVPDGELQASEKIDARQVAWLIQRPRAESAAATQQPKWLTRLRALFCGIYTVDNMDFVLRDAYMTGVSPKSFDVDRLLHYSFFTDEGLTIYDRGVPALVHFLSMKAELFRSVYFHRTVRAIDLELAELFRESGQHLFPGDPREHLDSYRDLTEFSLLSDVRQWSKSQKPRLRELGGRWSSWLSRKVPWCMVCHRNVSFQEGQSELTSIFADHQVFYESVRRRLPSGMQSVEFRVDLARHIHRPNTIGATAGQNFLFDASTGQVRPMTTHGLYKKLPVSHTIARIYARDREHEKQFADLLDEMLGHSVKDDLTNM